MGFINQLTSLGGLTLYESLLILGMITYGDPRSRYGLGIWKIHSHGWTTPIFHIAMVSFPISTLIHVYILHRFSWFMYVHVPLAYWCVLRFGNFNGNDPFRHHMRNFIIPATPSNPSSNPSTNPSSNPSSNPTFSTQQDSEMNGCR